MEETPRDRWSHRRAGQDWRRSLAHQQDRYLLLCASRIRMSTPRAQDTGFVRVAWGPDVLEWKSLSGTVEQYWHPERRLTLSTREQVCRAAENVMMPGTSFSRTHLESREAYPWDAHQWESSRSATRSQWITVTWINEDLADKSPFWCCCQPLKLQRTV